MATYIELLEEAVRRYAGAPVLDLIKTGPKQALGFERRNIEATLFFMDLRSFTRYTTQLPADTIMEELNLYFLTVSDLIVRHSGYIDSLIGDALFAIFGLEGGHHADLACAAALECLAALADINERPGRPFPFEAGIGINTGVVTVGNVGSPIKAKYTAMGGMVNLAARMEGLTAKYDTGIIITECTKRKLTKKFAMHELGVIPVKGLDIDMRIHALTGRE